MTDQSREELLAELAAVKAENERLRAALNTQQQNQQNQQQQQQQQQQPEHSSIVNENGLTNEEIRRYGRHLIMPEIGVSGQLKLRQASVLVVGAGGLGSPCILYLAAMGVGRLGVVDHDVLETSNLQRQIIHTEARAGTSKAGSARASVQALNSGCECTAHDTLLTSDNAMRIFAQYDIVVDASDNAATRYLINDVCVLLKKPLVSGSAVQMEGQLTVYNHRNGPCYRCMFPRPPPASTIVNCNDGGVLGVVPGVIGTLQALTVVRILLGMDADEAPYMLLFDALRTPHFRHIRIRGRQKQCAVCGDNPTITEPIDYVQFCGAGGYDDDGNAIQLLDPEMRMSAVEYKQMREANVPHLLLDVRPRVHLDICSLNPHAQVDWLKMEKSGGDQLAKDAIDSALATLTSGSRGGEEVPIVVICRRGNDSQLAVQLLKDKLGLSNIRDVTGGYTAYALHADSTFPIY